MFLAEYKSCVSNFCGMFSAIYRRNGYAANYRFTHKNNTNKTTLKLYTFYLNFFN